MRLEIKGVLVALIRGEFQLKIPKSGSGQTFLGDQSANIWNVIVISLVDIL